ncbi:MAG: F0F1 ATP synthase subunit delta [Candidatus Omnitrophota bacterium]
MMLSVFSRIFLMQFILTVVVVFILWKVLEARLVEFAIRRFEIWEPEEDRPLPKEIFVTSHKNLKSVAKQRILRSSLKNFGPQAKVHFQVDKSNLGGVIIKFGSDEIEYCLRERLKASGILK